MNSSVCGSVRQWEAFNVGASTLFCCTHEFFLITVVFGFGVATVAGDFFKKSPKNFVFHSFSQHCYWHLRTGILVMRHVQIGWKLEQLEHFLVRIRLYYIEHPIPGGWTNLTTSAGFLACSGRISKGFGRITDGTLENLRKNFDKIFMKFGRYWNGF